MSLYAPPVVGFICTTTTVTTSASVTTSSVQILAANPDRIALFIYNNSANSGYLTLGATSTSSTPTFILGTFAQFTWPFASIIYTGAISAIRNAGLGTFTCTEIVKQGNM